MTYYYNIKYDNGNKDIICSNKKLKKNLIVHINNKKAIVLNKASLRYTLDDLKIVLNILYTFNSGSEQVKLGNKIIDVINTNIPSIRFSKNDRAIFSDILNLNDNLSKDEKDVLNKILSHGGISDGF